MQKFVWRVQLQAKIEISVQILHYYEYLHTPDRLGMSFIVKSFILKISIINKWILKFFFYILDNISKQQ